VGRRHDLGDRAIAAGRQQDVEGPACQGGPDRFDVKTRLGFEDVAIPAERGGKFQQSRPKFGSRA
jgi:hypothetical protein